MEDLLPAYVVKRLRKEWNRH